MLEDTYVHIREAEQQLHLSDLPPAEAVRRLIAFTWNYYLAHPEFLTLLNSENLHRARHLERSARVRELNSPLIRTLGEILERGRVDGRVPRRRRPGAALHLDRRAGVLLPVATTTRCRRSSGAT